MFKTKDFGCPLLVVVIESSYGGMKVNWIINYKFKKHTCQSCLSLLKSPPLHAGEQVGYKGLWGHSGTAGAFVSLQRTGTEISPAEHWKKNF